MIDILISLLVFLILFAIISYVLTAFIPMDPRLRQLVMLVLGLIFLIWILLAVSGYAPTIWHGRPWH
jgi:uncharacterized membrane protein